MDSIMGKARDEKAQGFTPPALDTFTPPELRDDVERVVAAGMKILYGNDMREEVQQELARNVPMAQKLGEAVVGLLLTLDQQSRGGIPEAVLAPAAQALLGEAAEIAQAAGQPVTEEEFRDASIVAFQTLGRKLGYTEEQMLGAVGGGAEKSAPGAELPEDGEPMANPRRTGEPMEPDDEGEYEEDQP